MKARRKWLLISIAFALLLAGALVIPFLVDEPPHDDADLRVTPVDVPPEENGFLVLDVKSEDIRLPGQVGDRDALYLLRQLAAGKDWDPETAREILEKNAEVLRKLDASLRLPRFQLRDASASLHPVLPIDLPPLEGPWIGIVYLALIRVQALLLEGRSSEALDQAWAIVTFGQRLQGGGGRLIEFHVGMSAEKLGLAQLRSLTRRDDAALDLVLPLARRLGSFSSREAAVVPLKTWYELERSWLQAGMESGAIKSIAVGIPSIWSNNLCLKPNQTRRLLADAVRTIIRNKGHPESWKAHLEPTPPPYSWLSRLPHPNAVGRSAVWWILSTVEGVPYRAARTDLDRAFTAALIAIECWRARHDGTLPPALDALVPEYLEAVPTDPYDGKPLKYSAEKKILYSVGGDGEDAGGSRRTDDGAAFEDGKEPTLRLRAFPP